MVAIPEGGADSAGAEAGADETGAEIPGGGAAGGVLSAEGTGLSPFGCLNLVDLAGSEWARDQAAHATERIKETQEVI